MTPEELESYRKEGSDYPPDKGSEWKYGVDEDHWMLSHNALRGEMDELQKALRVLGLGKAIHKLDDEGAEWKLNSLQQIWQYHKQHVELHHKSEEEILQPFLETRCKYPEKASEGHKGLEDTLNKLDDEMNHLKNQEDIAKGIAAFSKDFDTYRSQMMAHLEAEEQFALPLIRAYFAPAEFKDTGKRMGKEGGHSGSFVYYAGEDTFRNELMAKWGMPSFVWYLAFATPLKEYQAGVLKHVEAIEKNEPPPEDASSCVVQ